VQRAKLTASDAEASDWFGRSVAISRDSIIIGSDGNDDNGSFSGSAYLFIRPAAGWNDTKETAKLTASDASANDQFGNSVAISDGTLVIGAYGNDTNVSASGSAYVFELRDLTFLPAVMTYLLD